MSAVSGLLGLACRAGQIALGADIALQEIRAGKAALALLDAGASEGPRKKLLDACTHGRRRAEGESGKADAGIVIRL